MKSLPVDAWMHACGKDLAWDLFHVYAALNLHF